MGIRVGEADGKLLDWAFCVFGEDGIWYRNEICVLNSLDCIGEASSE